MHPKLVEALARLDRLKKVQARSADPLFDKIVELTNFVLAGRNWEFKMFTDFFEGGDAQKTYFTRFEKETDEEYYRRLDQSVVINKARGAVLKGARSLYAISQPERRMEDETAQERMQDTWKFNGIHTGMFHLDLAVEIGKYGFAVAQNIYVDKKNRAPVFHNPGPAGRKSNEVLYVLQQSPLMIPIPRRDRKTEMGAIIRMTMKADDEPFNIGASQSKDIGYIELVTDYMWVMWQVDFNRSMFGRDTLTGNRVPVRFGPGYEDMNPYGDVNVPFTLYRASNDSKLKIWGVSDLSDILEPQTHYNQVLSDDGHVIANNTFPILFAKGLSLKDDWRRGPNDTVSSTNVQSDMGYVTWDANLEASAAHEDRLERSMREVSGHSPVIDGDLRNIGQVRNLRGAMMPELMSVNHKQIAMADGETEHARATLEMIEFHEETGYPDKAMDIVFGEDFIPVDDLTSAETDLIRLSSGVKNLLDLIRRENPEFTSEEVSAKLEETLGLLKRTAETKAQTDGGQRDVSPTGEERRRAQQNQQ